MKVIGVIPARYASTRFPGKPLCAILGKPMIQWVYERASRAPSLDQLLVATDDERIERAVQAFGGKAVRGRAFDLVLNIQGDEPTLEPECVEALVGLMSACPAADVGTLVSPVRTLREFKNPNVVKVALGEEGRCLYFSRSPIPYPRGRRFRGAPLFRHVGLYAYRRKVLEAFTSWPPGDLESTESLEQLRLLARGVDVRAAVVAWRGCAVDSPEDVAPAAALLRKAGKGTRARRAKGRAEDGPAGA
jgi:CMP-2-keto-3-deoxyoctulosonic acid synthetase